jgi:hypothetical protein
MSRHRRPLVLLALALSSLIIAACSDASVTAPRHDDPVDSTAFCRSGTWTGVGRC